MPLLTPLRRLFLSRAETTASEQQGSCRSAAKGMTMNGELRRLSPADVQALLTQPGFVGVDVREPYEFEVGHLLGSLHIPLGELPGRLDEIPSDRIPVFLCRMGGRSLAACELALQAGRMQAVNLEGGLRAWAAQVDPGLEVA